MAPAAKLIVAVEPAAGAPAATPSQPSLGALTARFGGAIAKDDFGGPELQPPPARPTGPAWTSGTASCAASSSSLARWR